MLDRVVPSGEPLLVACSGGADSSSALIAVARSGRSVTAAHFDHRLRSREEAAADRAVVSALAAALHVPLLCGEGTGASPAEEAAREERYHWLASAAAEAGAAHVVTGHTLDDQAETVLFRLVRGAGLAGAAGMADVAPWPVAAGEAMRVVRPLLGIERREIEAYLAALGIEPRHDSTNDDPAYSRNRIRHRVLPDLGAINPQVARALADFAVRAARDDEALEAWAEAAFASLACVEPGRVTLDRARLRALPGAVRARVIRQAAAHLGTALLAAHIEAAERAIRRSGTAVSLPSAGLEVQGETVLITRVHEGG